MFHVTKECYKEWDKVKQENEEIKCHLFQYLGHQS